MAARFIQILLAGILFCVTTINCQRVCVDGITKCQQGFQATSGLQKKNMTPSGHVSRESLQIICNGYRSYKSCTSRLWKDCPLEMIITYKAIQDTFSNMCEKDNVNETLKHSECLSRDSAKQKVLRCNTKGKDQLSDFSKNICESLTEKVRCTVRAIEHECGDEDAEYLGRTLKSSLRPLAFLINCDISAAGSLVSMRALKVLMSIFVVQKLLFA